MTSEPENDPAEETRDPAALSRRTVSFCDLQWSAIRRHAATRDQTRAEWIREACNAWMQTQQQADYRNAVRESEAQAAKAQGYTSLGEGYVYIGKPRP